GHTVTADLGAVSAAFPAGDGAILYAGGNKVAVFGPGPSGEWTSRTIAQAPARDGLRFNDASVDPAGRLWVGSMDIEEAQPLGELYRLDPGGVLAPVVSGATVSNGLGWSPEGSRMYYADPPTRRVAVFDYDQATGQASARRVFADLGDAKGRPDGPTVD